MLWKQEGRMQNDGVNAKLLNNKARTLGTVCSCPPLLARLVWMLGLSSVGAAQQRSRTEAVPASGGSRLHVFPPFPRLTAPVAPPASLLSPQLALSLAPATTLRAWRRGRACVERGESRGCACVECLFGGTPHQGPLEARKPEHLFEEPGTHCKEPVHAS